MSSVLLYVSGIAIFLAGVAAGALTMGRRRERRESDSAVAGLTQSIVKLETRLSAQESTVADRVQQMGALLDEQAAQLAEIRSTPEIVRTMEQILAWSMASLDDRLSNQAHSIEVLRATVSQTDILLERVLESLDSLQPCSESNEPAAETEFQRPGR